MAKLLHQWLEDDVNPIRGKSVRWLSENHFFRDPSRPVYSDASFFFSPADGVILYQKITNADEELIDIKGMSFTLQDAMRDKTYSRESLVIGIFMTFYDVHVNRVPLSGRLSYKELPTIDTHNYPMLDIEKGLLDELSIATHSADYLFNNQRLLNRIYSSELQQTYYILQIADYDVDSITPFELKQNQRFAQNQRFSQIRYGSQVDLIIPLSESYDFEFLLEDGMHVEAGIDPLIRIVNK